MNTNFIRKTLIVWLLFYTNIVSYGSDEAEFKNLLYLEPGQVYRENSGARGCEFYLHRGWLTEKKEVISGNPEVIYNETAVIHDETKGKHYIVPLNYRNGHLSCSISSPCLKRFKLYFCRKIKANTGFTFSSSQIRFFLRGFTENKEIDLPQIKLLKAVNEKMPLNIMGISDHYWLQNGHTIEVKVFYEERELPNHPIFLFGPGGIKVSSETDSTGHASFIVPEIDGAFFKDRFDQLPLVIWTGKKESIKSVRYIASETFMVHPQHLHGRYFKNAGILVIGLSILFTVLFVFLRKRQKTDEIY